MTDAERALLVQLAHAVRGIIAVEKIRADELVAVITKLQELVIDEAPEDPDPADRGIRIRGGWR